MPKDAGVVGADLRAHGLRLLGGFVGLELRTATKREQEIQKGVEIGMFFQSLGGSFLIAADSGDPRRVKEAGHVDPPGGLTAAQTDSLGGGLDDLAAALKSSGIQLVLYNQRWNYVSKVADA